MDNDMPTLEVGFTISAGTSFEELRRLQAFMHTAEFKALKSAESMEGAFNRLHFTGAKVQVEGFGNVTTQQMGRAEKAADRLTAQLNRQIETFGKTAAQVRQIKVDKLAADFDRLGNSIDAEKLRALSAELVRIEFGGSSADRNDRQAGRSPHAEPRVPVSGSRHSDGRCGAKLASVQIGDDRAVAAGRAD